ncbi:PHP-associated domain-containing protein [Kitasatospora griseola]|uniref:PHP-associated domain-containing protein n=1 Tax=Kitasatospora griseola TaxID=2064 RepID=UPI00381B546C
MRTGRWQPALGNSDTHLTGRLGTPQTVVFAEEFSAPAILAALRAGRSWIAEAAAVHLEFTAEADGREAGIGERPATAGRPVELRLELAGVPDPQVRVHTERGKAPWQEGRRISAAETCFVRVEVRHPDGRTAAPTNPTLLS